MSMPPNDSDYSCESDYEDEAYWPIITLYEPEDEETFPPRGWGYFSPTESHPPQS